MSAAPALSLEISSSAAELLIPFPLALQKVFDRLEAIATEVAGSQKKPSEETFDWAREVLLRVVPTAYLKSAEINPFESEIHVTWENESNGKSLIVFFPGPDQIKIYYERLENREIAERDLVNATAPAEVSARLHWMFQ